MRGLFIFIVLTFSLVSGVSAGQIYEAAKKGDLGALTAALNTGADVNKMAGGATPLYFAAIRGHLDAAELLIVHGADVNVKTKFGTPLMAAAARDTAELIELFLANGADPNSDLEGQTALHVATERGCLDCVKALVEAGSNVNAQHRIDSGQHILVTTPLHLAIANGHGDIADYLMAHGVILPRPAPIADKLASADLDKGRVFFEGECHACHAINPEQVVQLGPNLWNIIGRDKASLDDHEYSKTLLALQGEWTYEDLNTFLSGPTVTTPGVNMEVQGAPNEVDRINLIAYLRTLSDNPEPMP